MAFVRMAFDVFRPGTADEAIARVRRELVPVLERQPGFIAYEVVRTGEDTAAFIHTCATRDQVTAAVAAVADWSRENMTDLVLSVETQLGEIVIASRR